MKPLKMITLLLVLAPALATVQAKTKKPDKLPAMFNQAQYVWVEAVDGQELDMRLLPEDRRAIGDVYKALHDWRRYVITASRDQAELIFVVRKGRLAGAGGGVPVSSGPQSGPRGVPQPAGASGPFHGVDFGGEVGPPDDLLEVYMRSPNDAHGTLLWRNTLADGLNPPDLPLFQQLRDEVDRDYPPQAANQQQKP